VTGPFTLQARALTPFSGPVAGVGLAFDVGLSFWGGVDSTDGRIIDHSHPGLGRVITDHVLCLPSGRGSGSASSVFAECIRTRTAPAAILLARADAILVTGALVAHQLYAYSCPVLVCPDWMDHRTRLDGAQMTLSESGSHIRIRVMSD